MIHNRRLTFPFVTQMLLALAFLASYPAAADDGSKAAKKWNVLFLTVDDMNWDSVGVFGCPIKDITPNIDKLASQGVRFRHAHVTIAICQPTRAVWMTGRYPHRSGALGFDPIRAGVPTLLEALKTAGYYTGIMAKVPHVVPTRRHAWDKIIPASALRTGRDPKLYYAKSTEFFRQAKESGQPFFLMANSQDPHRPFAGSRQEQQRRGPRKKRKKKIAKQVKKSQSTERGKNKKLPKRRKAVKNQNRKRRANFPAASRTYLPAEVPVPGFLPNLPAVRREMAQYYTSVHRADEIVGSVLKALDESGLASQTIVVFMSDHGMPLPFAKTNCWYHSTRTPWIVRWPTVVKPGRHDTSHFVSGVDFAPTILDAVGLKPLPGMDGRSFLPVLQGRPQAGRDHVITHINRTAGRKQYPMRSVLTRRYGYIYNGWSDGKMRFRNESQNGLTMRAMIQAGQDDQGIAKRVQHFLFRTPEELYDYQADPDARRNLINDPRHRDKIAELRGTLQTHMEQTKDPQLSAFRRLLTTDN